MKQLAVFDLDGTLVDSLGDIADSMNRVLVREGLPAHPGEAYRQFVGNGMPVLCRRALGEDADEARLQRVLAAMRREYVAHQLDQTAPYAGIPELLDHLAARDVRCAVLTNKPHPATCLMLASLFPAVTFDGIQGHEEGKPHKPDPRALTGLLDTLGVAAEAAIMVGDSGVDMATARAAGVEGIGVLWGFRDAAELREHGATALIERPEELLHYV